jgi:hypothetical protein
MQIRKAIRFHFLTCPFTHTYRIFTTCTLRQVTVFQYAPQGTPTSHTHHPHRKTPTPHKLFHLPGLEDTHPHLYAESPKTNYAQDNKSRTSRAEDNSIKSTSFPPKTAHIKNSNSIWIILKTTRSRYKLWICTTTKTCNLYSFSLWYNSVTWRWPTAAETCRREHNKQNNT